MLLNGETRLVPIIGDPVIFAKSPERLTGGFTARGCNAICLPMQVPEAALASVMIGLSMTGNIDGLLITMPHKFKAFEYCATASDRSKLFGVVSVMRRNPDRSWHGDMLDGLAFVKAQIDNGAKPQGARALLIGAGGAGSAIAQALLSAGVIELSIFDTDQSRVTQLLKLLSDSRVREGPPDPTGCDIVCNATPMGMSEADPLPVDSGLLTPAMFVGDVIAGHGMTPLLQAARAKGCKTSDGTQMVEAVQEMMLDFMLGSDRIITANS